MDVFYPAYYHNFRCIANRCPDSCCKEWAVDVDSDAAAFYRSLPGPLGDRLRSVLTDTGDGTIMSIENGRCPMWQDDGLCRIQAELGHDALCKTCRQFPRLTHDYGDFMELGLELSCPEAARLILSRQNTGMLVQVQPGGTEPEYDPEIMAILRQSRQEVLAFLQDAPSLPDALAVILLHSHSLQAQIDGAEATSFEPEVCLATARQYVQGGDPATLLHFFAGLEILTPQWSARLAQTPAEICWSPELKAFAQYMIQRYWLQTISDFDLVCRVKLTVAACLLIGFLGGDVTETAQLFSKEIENDPDNVDAILDSAYTSPALTDVHLLSLLLNA